MKERIKFYNTLTRKKEIFKPIKSGEVGIYTCGPTVYWYPHIGNLRSYIFPDILKRFLKVSGYRVKHVVNVTDVGHLVSDGDEGEDKIEKTAKQQGKTAKEISEYYFEVFRQDIKKLNLEEPDIWSKATEHIKEQIELIKKLEEKGYTYSTDDGIYFDTSKLKNYGNLAKLNIEGLEAGKRTSLRGKRNKTDFALWKFSEETGIRQQEWNSPWGIGFPGWHIECSAMSMKYLGETIDIHTGGEDHVSVHHTNEIAQSEAATGKKFVNYWIHGAFLTSKGEKISKSKGGLYTLSELEEKGYSAMDLKYFYLSAHYRKPLNFTIENLNSARNSLKRAREIISKLNKKQKINSKNVDLSYSQFNKYLEDDLNFPRALSYLWEILRENKLNESEKYQLILKFDEIFNLELNKEEKIEIPESVRKLVNEREEKRKEKKFDGADKIREKINKLGFIVEDTKKGIVVKKID